jgi:TolB protein
MYADGSGSVVVTSGTQASWSPDGTKLVFTRGSRIAVIDADGTGLHRLTPRRTNVFAGDPAWSPDGTKIAYRFTDCSGNIGCAGPDIYVMNADGSNPTRLTETGGLQSTDPNWSPDGTQIAFAMSGADPSYATTFNIFVMDADGSHVTKVTSDPYGIFGDPAWSPDGTQIVYFGNDHDRFGQSDIFVINADGSGEVNLTNTPRVNERFPDWGVPCSTTCSAPSTP